MTRSVAAATRRVAAAAGRPDAPRHPERGDRMTSAPQVPGVEVRGTWREPYAEVLTEDALALLARLHRRFGPRRAELLRGAAPPRRGARGRRPAGLPAVHEGDPGRRLAGRPPRPVWPTGAWRSPGPTDRKMVVNALNSGARVFMADFEDSNTPTFDNLVSGQLNLRDALLRQIDFTSPEGKSYALGRRGRHAGGPPPRLAPARAARPGRRRAGQREPLRLLPVHDHERADRARPRHRALLLPAEDGEPPRGAAVERRLRRDPGGAGHPAGHHPGDRASSRRSWPRSRWRRSSTSCASTRRG